MNYSLRKHISILTGALMALASHPSMAMNINNDFNLLKDQQQLPPPPAITQQEVALQKLNKALQYIEDIIQNLQLNNEAAPDGVRKLINNDIQAISQNKSTEFEQPEQDNYRQFLKDLVQKYAEPKSIQFVLDDLNYAEQFLVNKKPNQTFDGGQNINNNPLEGEQNNDNANNTPIVGAPGAQETGIVVPKRSLTDKLFMKQDGKIDPLKVGAMVAVPLIIATAIGLASYYAKKQKDKDSKKTQKSKPEIIPTQEKAIAVKS